MSHVVEFCPVIACNPYLVTGINLKLYMMSMIKKIFKTTRYVAVKPIHKLAVSPKGKKLQMLVPGKKRDCVYEVAGKAADRGLMGNVPAWIFDLL